MLAVVFLAILLLVHHHDARLSREAQFLLKPVDRLEPLRVGQSLAGLRVDRRVIERPLGAAAGPYRLHLEERAAEVLGRGAAHLFQLHALVGVRAVDVIDQALPARRGSALDNQGSGLRPSAVMISARIAAMSFRISASSARLGVSRPSFKALAI